MLCKVLYISTVYLENFLNCIFLFNVYNVHKNEFKKKQFILVHLIL